MKKLILGTLLLLNSGISMAADNAPKCILNLRELQLDGYPLSEVLRPEVQRSFEDFFNHNSINKNPALAGLSLSPVNANRLARGLHSSIPEVMIQLLPTAKKLFARFGVRGKNISVGMTTWSGRLVFGNDVIINKQTILTAKEFLNARAHTLSEGLITTAATMAENTTVKIEKTSAVSEEDAGIIRKVQSTGVAYSPADSLIEVATKAMNKSIVVDGPAFGVALKLKNGQIISGSNLFHGDLTISAFQMSLANLLAEGYRIADIAELQIVEQATNSSKIRSVAAQFLKDIEAQSVSVRLKTIKALAD